MKRCFSVFLAAVLAAGCGGRADGDGQGAGGSGGADDAGVGGAGTGGSGNSTPIDAGPPDVGVSDAGPPPGQNILFEVSYENYAWGAKLNGVFITVDGAVYSYDYFASSDAGTTIPAVIFPATEDELRARYGSSPTQIGSVPMGELLAKFALIQPAASGVLLSEYACADAGETSYLGYLYDVATARYSRVIFGVDGDHASKSTAPVAGELVSWLKQVGAVPSFCEFMGVQCTGAMCNSPPPACPSGQVASVVNDCWGECVQVNRCLEVTDCSVCGGGGIACAISTTGSHHCLPMYCASTDVCACPFAPPCAGGEDYCSNTGSLEVHCGP